MYETSYITVKESIDALQIITVRIVFLHCVGVVSCLDQSCNAF